MARSLLLLVAVFTSFVVPVTSQSGSFINPPPGPCTQDEVDDAQSYNIGDEVLLSWTTDIPTVTVVLWQGVDGTSNRNFDIPGARE